MYGRHAHYNRARRIIQNLVIHVLQILLRVIVLIWLLQTQLPEPKPGAVQHGVIVYIRHVKVDIHWLHPRINAWKQIKIVRQAMQPRQQNLWIYQLEHMAHVVQPNVKKVIHYPVACVSRIKNKNNRPLGGIFLNHIWFRSHAGGEPRGNP